MPESESPTESAAPRTYTAAELLPYLQKAGFTCSLTKGKAAAVNGEADSIRIDRDSTLEIIRTKLSWSSLKLKNPAFKKMPTISYPWAEWTEIFYRCDTTGDKDTYLACDEEGDPVAATISVTFLSPGYILDGRLTQIPTITPAEREAVHAIFRLFDQRDASKEVAKRVMPSAKDFMPRSESGFPPLDDENLALIYSTMNPTEDNVALVFEARYKDELRYCKTWGQWLKWNECKWESEHTLLAFHYSREIARRVNQTKGASAPAKSGFARGVESFSRASRAFATISDDWDRNAWLLNTPHGTVNLETGVMTPHCKTDYLTKCCRVSPRDGARPIFDRFLRDITLEDGGLAEYLQRSLGACLSGAMQDNFLLFWYGDKGQNGKNTLSELIAWMIGDYADFIPTETLMSNKNPQHLTFLASLRGLRLAVCSEVAEGSYWNEQRVKSLTGDARISANYMRHDPFTFDRTHKHIVLGNHRPMLRIVDPAIKARLHIVPFRAHFDHETKDPQMGEKLRSEAPQILQWLIDGHARWMEDGRILKKCSAVESETLKYFEAQSTNEMWVEECCLEGEDRNAQAGELYRSFKTWKELRGEGVPSQTRFSEWLANRYTKRKIHGYMVYDGITLRPETALHFQA